MIGYARPLLLACVALFALADQLASAQPPTSAASEQPNRGAIVDPQPEIEQVGWFRRRRRVVTFCPPATEPAPTQQVPPASPEQADQKPATPPSEAPSTDEALSSSLETAGAPEALAPNMIGDFIGTFFTGGATSAPVTPTPPTVVAPGELSSQEIAQLRTVVRYKIADFNSPIPKTRLLFSFNYFQDAFQTTGEVYRYFGGFEYAFLNNQVSLEVRTSLNNFSDFPNEPTITRFGDLRTHLKFVLTQGEQSLVSGGMTIGWPSASVPDGTPRDNYYISPSIGYLRTWGNWFLQGFEQLDIPTASEDQVLLHTDVGVGLWVRNDPSRLVSRVAPTVELHLYTPFGPAASGSLTGLNYNDVLNMTMGSTMVIGERLWVAAGLGVPLSTSKDYDFEVQLHAELRF